MRSQIFLFKAGAKEAQKAQIKEFRKTSKQQRQRQ